MGASILIEHCVLKESFRDLGGYTTLLFENLDNPEHHRYIMCVVYPNWEHQVLHKGESGYLKYMEVIEGETTWYNPETKEMIPYKSTDSIFLKFIKETDNDDIILLILLNRLILYYNG